MSLFFLFLADGQWKQRMNTGVNIVLDQKVFIHLGMPKEFFLISTYFIKKRGGGRVTYRICEAIPFQRIQLQRNKMK